MTLDARASCLAWTASRRRGDFEMICGQVLQGPLSCFKRGLKDDCNSAIARLPKRCASKEEALFKCGRAAGSPSRACCMLVARPAPTGHWLTTLTAHVCWRCDEFKVSTVRNPSAQADGASQTQNLLWPIAAATSPIPVGALPSSYGGSSGAG